MIKVELRLATLRHLPQMFEWRNQAEVYQGFYNQSEPLCWEEHLAWWNSLSILPTRRQCFIISYGGRWAGAVNITHLDTACPEVGYYIGELSLWRKGIATEGVRLALDWLEAQGYDCCESTTFQRNKASIRVLEKLGFQCAGESYRSPHLVKGIHLSYNKKLKGRE